MIGAGEHRLAAGGTYAEGDLVAVGGDDDPVGDAECRHALEDANDDGDAGEEP
jgi:hypothetical protein